MNDCDSLNGRNDIYHFTWYYLINILKECKNIQHYSHFAVLSVHFFVDKLANIGTKMGFICPLGVRECWKY